MSTDPEGGVRKPHSGAMGPRVAVMAHPGPEYVVRAPAAGSLVWTTFATPTSAATAMVPLFVYDVHPRLTRHTIPAAGSQAAMFGTWLSGGCAPPPRPRTRLFRHAAPLLTVASRPRTPLPSGASFPPRSIGAALPSPSPSPTRPRSSRTCSATPACPSSSPRRSSRPS